MKKSVLAFASLGLVAAAIIAFTPGENLIPREPAETKDAFSFFANRPLDKDRHVLLMHVDGFQVKLFQEMLKAGQLPHLQFLLSNGGSHFAASTVDKSETMKVIPAVMSSKVDTRLTAWWQFDRQTMGFRNFWIEPVEVVNYALGMDFPMYPTVLDAIAKDGHADRDVVSGFSLYRRGVPTENYSRIYLEGFDSVSSYRYYRQAFASMTELLALLKRQATAGTYPRLTTSLLAPIDEMIHLNGVTKRGETRNEYCFERSKNGGAPPDDVMDMIPELRRQGLVGRQFTRVKMASAFSDKVSEICVKAPVISLTGPNGALEPAHVYPEVALAAVVVDLNVGRLMNSLREIRLDDGKVSIQKIDPGLALYAKNAKLESSAFEKTLFLIYGDHGMTDTFKLMNPPSSLVSEKYNRDAGSIAYPYSQVLAENFGLKAYIKDHWAGDGQKIVMDYANLPPEVSAAWNDDSWQSPETRELVKKTQTQATNLFAQATKTATSVVHDEYWYLFFLKSFIVDPKLQSAFTKGHDQAMSILTSTLLRGNADYISAARAHAIDYFNKNVGMVYGGGALNNAELFLPHQSNGQIDWSTRPTYKEILAAFDGQFLPRLMKTPGVGLVFIRQENASITADMDMQNEMHIDVLDTSMNRGQITVRRDAASHQLLFRYQALGKKDPLDYEAQGSRQGRWGNYQEWNDLSIQNRPFFDNVVAGIGSYLYSSSAAIGDVLIMHAYGWNFGENLAGHGGLETEEKIVPMIAVGPGVAANSTLQSVCAYSTDSKGHVSATSALHAPTVLDVAPTALAYLGYPVHHGEGELTRFSREGFKDYLKAWRNAQMTNCSANGLYVLSSTLQKLGFQLPANDRASAQKILGELCHAIEQNPLPQFPDYAKIKEDGCVLDFARGPAL